MQDRLEGWSSPHLVCGCKHIRAIARTNAAFVGQRYMFVSTARMFLVKFRHITVTPCVMLSNLDTLYACTTLYASAITVVILTGIDTINTKQQCTCLACMYVPVSFANYCWTARHLYTTHVFSPCLVRASHAQFTAPTCPQPPPTPASHLPASSHTPPPPRPRLITPARAAA